MCRRAAAPAPRRGVVSVDRLRTDRHRSARSSRTSQSGARPVTRPFLPRPPPRRRLADTAAPASATAPPPTADDTAPIAAPTTVAAPPPRDRRAADDRRRHRRRRRLRDGPSACSSPATCCPTSRCVDQAREYGGGSTYDFTPMFHAVAPLIASADLAICHLETPVAPPGTPPDPTPPDYGVPAEIAAGIAAAGFDRCSLASNHVMDKGAAGIDATLAAFDAAASATPAWPARRRRPVHNSSTSTAITIAHLSYTFSYNGMPVANGEPWRSNLIDPDRIVAEARQAPRARRPVRDPVGPLGRRRRHRGDRRPAALGRADHCQRCRRRASSGTMPTSCSRSSRSTAAGSCSGSATSSAR